MSTSWESVDRVVDQTTEKIEQEEEEVNRLLSKVVEHRARIQRLRKTLKLAEKRSIEQAKCLSDQIDEEAAAAGNPDNSHIVRDFEPGFQALSSMTPGTINALLGDAPPSPLSREAAVAPSGQGP